MTQYISNAFKEIISREPRFKGLLLGKPVIALINSLVYQVLDRYVNVLKSLLLVSDSKTITDHLAVIATMILLRDDIHTSEDDVKVVVDLLQERIDEIKASHREKRAGPTDEEVEVEEEAAEPEETPAEEKAAPARASKKKA